MVMHYSGHVLNSLGCQSITMGGIFREGGGMVGRVSDLSNELHSHFQSQAPMQMCVTNQAGGRDLPIPELQRVIIGC
jgi:hypothetical protein